MSDAIALDVNHLSKTYGDGPNALTVLDDVSFAIKAGTTNAIVGPSGSGKTTLLGLCAGLDRASLGTVSLGGVSLGNLDEDQRARLRSEKVGFVFQSFQLIPTLSALENAMVPLELRQEQNVRARAVDQLGRVGLGDRLDHYPAQLSGGEQQRVAIARAFINRPTILFADEPTGNLDDDTSGRVQDLLFELNEAAATTLILVTHNLELARLTRRIIRLQGGRIASDDSTP
ncbi:MAG: ABC transporter ATP-binding protein [Gemmatimonadetes bacterium]|jgi:putative ABC transport system ATP-binding protein|nr:ABC transporter ATP-binding protein [Gemmatimonadota bacterium]MBT5451656.1 ABC transporter ATP-binding protein [Gemmatimonadota bacterium]MBT5800381.1 ABC transporter ATP-binding protein [Gemmatimonadota bacterium]MBT7587374.1 ABC transporter ATP-binding protein [Gemmatimonadota bacterium]